MGEALKALPALLNNIGLLAVSRNLLCNLARLIGLF